MFGLYNDAGMTWVKQMPLVSTPLVEDNRFQLFILTFSLFVVGIPILLWGIGQFSVRTYFIVVFIWLLITSEIFAPANSDVTWWRRLQWLKALGWIVLAYIVYERVAAVL